MHLCVLCCGMGWDRIHHCCDSPNVDRALLCSLPRGAYMCRSEDDALRGLVALASASSGAHVV